MPHSTGVCVLLIDLSHAAATTSSEGTVLSQSAVTGLCDRLVAAETPATWGLPAAELANASEQLTAVLTRGEVALLAERTWAGGQSDRGQFVSGLARSLALVQTAGYRPTTLVLSEGPPALPDDLLLKFGITAVCLRQAHSAAGAPLAARRARQAPPSSTNGCLRPLRWGLWEMAGAIDLFEAGLRRTIKAIDRAAREVGDVAVVIDGDKLLGGLKPLARLLDHLARLRADQRLLTRTVAELVSNKTPRRQLPAARSILRAA